MGKHPKQMPSKLARDYKLLLGRRYAIFVRTIWFELKHQKFYTSAVFIKREN